ncbi:hypothetical protein L249_1356, partial [Ophiocordyceps polyrhachis-furcata BCC 54312]
MSTRRSWVVVGGGAWPVVEKSGRAHIHMQKYSHVLVSLSPSLPVTHSVSSQCPHCSSQGGVSLKPTHLDCLDSRDRHALIQTQFFPKKRYLYEKTDRLSAWPVELGAKHGIVHFSEPRHFFFLLTYYIRWLYQAFPALRLSSSQGVERGEGGLTINQPLFSFTSSPMTYPCSLLCLLACLLVRPPASPGFIVSDTLNSLAHEPPTRAP